MLTLQNVSVVRKAGLRSSGFPVLKDVSLNLELGQVYTIFGHSGSGKTTLLNVMNGRRTPFPHTKFEGEVLFEGEPVLSKAASFISPKRESEGLSRLKRAFAFHDEAYAGMGKGATRSAQADMDEFRRRNLSAVFVTHNLPATAQASDVLYHLNGGEVVWTGTVQDLQGDKLPEATANYLTYAEKVFDWRP